MKLWKEWEKGDRDYLHTPMERVKLEDVDGKCVCEPKTTSARARLLKHHGFQEYVEVKAEPVIEAPVAEEKPKKKSKSKRLEEVAKAASEAGE